MADAGEPLEIRAGIAAYPRERHGDHLLRPARRVVHQRRWALKRWAAKIERQRNPRIAGEVPNDRSVALGLAAEHQLPPAGGEPIIRAAAIANAVVDPESEPRKRRPQPRQRGMIVSPARD